MGVSPYAPVMSDVRQTPVRRTNVERFTRSERIQGTTDLARLKAALLSVLDLCSVDDLQL